MTAPSPARKPALSEGVNPYYEGRPCTDCHHAASAHGVRCGIKGCRCRKYTPDTTPEFLLRTGLHSGDWQYIAIDQLRTFLRPGEPVKHRVYAYLLLKAIGQANGKDRNTGRLAVKFVEKGKPLAPIQPDDILRDLNKLDTLDRIDKNYLRRMLHELECEGRIRQVGRVRKNIKLFVYARPLKRRVSVPPLPLEKPKNLGVELHPQILETPTDDNYLRDKLVQHLRGPVVKAIRKAFRDTLGSIENLGVNLHPEKFIEETVEQVLLGVWDHYQKARLGVNSSGVYKEASSLPYREENGASSSSSTGTVESAAQTTTTEPDAFHSAICATFRAAGKTRFPNRKQTTEMRVQLREHAPAFLVFLTPETLVKRNVQGPGLLPHLVDEFLGSRATKPVPKNALCRICGGCGIAEVDLDTDTTTYCTCEAGKQRKVLES